MAVVHSLGDMSSEAEERRRKAARPPICQARDIWVYQATSLAPGDMPEVNKNTETLKSIFWSYQPELAKKSIEPRSYESAAG